MTLLYFKAIVLSIAFFYAFSVPVSALENSDLPSKCGTFSANAIARMKALRKGEKVLEERPSMPFTHTSPSGKFLIHYTNSGKDSVPQGDVDQNGIPDWVDSTGIYIDYVHKIEVEDIKFLSPPTDGTKGGTIQYDIYIMDLSKEGIYGQTVADGNVTGGIFLRSFSFIRIDNNFSPADVNNSKPVFNTYGYEALKVTLAHEYHHAIQYGYGASTGSFHEMMSTWMEYRVYPDINDYLVYVNNFFTKNDKYFFGQSDAEKGYSYCLVLEYCHELYGDEFIRRVWDLVGFGVDPVNPIKGLEPYRALDSVFVERGSSLTQAWRGILPWMYYTGQRTIPGSYFKKADIFPEFTFTTQELYSPPSFTHTQQIKPYQIHFSRCILPADIQTNTPDSADFLVTYPNLVDIIQQSQRPGEYTVVCSEEVQPKQIMGTRYWYDVTSTNPEMWYELIVRNGIATTLCEDLFPNPFHLSHDEFIYIPAPPDARVSDAPYLSIYTVDWKPIFSGVMTISAGAGNKRVIAWKPNVSELTSNVYVYTVVSHGKTTVGKFSVVQ
ncbi:MAG: hypothetical protein IPM69_11770 [Ignavibacteria bacterium]|nr:hypothetical protein [Ignavibacteria bacterium]